MVRRGREPLTFDEAVRLEEAVLGGSKVQPSGKPSGEWSDTTEGEEGGVGLGHHRGYLSRGLYVDHLKRWQRFFGEEQMLVLKSEEFFENPQQTLDTVFEFLDLPQWEPEVSEIKPKKRNAGRYEEEMDPETRRRLEEYFEPHNRRLYEFLGTDFGW